MVCARNACHRCAKGAPSATGMFQSDQTVSVADSAKTLYAECLPWGPKHPFVGQGPVRVSVRLGIACPCRGEGDGQVGVETFRSSSEVRGRLPSRRRPIVRLALRRLSDGAQFMTMDPLAKQGRWVRDTCGQKQTAVQQGAFPYPLRGWTCAFRSRKHTQKVFKLK